MKYIVINADVKDSRKMKFNSKDFYNIIIALNEEFKENIIVKFSILKGDEIQGLFNLNIDIFRLVRKLKYFFYPYILRIGIGIGTIIDEEDVNKVSTSWELNGDAFFKARDAIDIMKAKKGKKEFNYNVYFKSDNLSFDNTINLFYSYIDDITCGWKEDILEITFLEEQGLTHEKIAEIIVKKNYDKNSISNELIKKARINITKKINTANWYKIKQTETVLLMMLRGEIYK